MPSKVETRTELPLFSALRIMVEKIPILHEDATIGDAENLLVQAAKNLASINYVYLIDREKKLVGVLSVREIFIRPKTAPLKEAAVKNLISVRPHTMRERVAFLAIEHNLKEIPVVDADNHLLGAVPYDAILRTLREEHIEDALRSAGIHSFNDPGTTLIKASAFTLIKKRIPWLIVGLLGSTLSAMIVSSFTAALEAIILLAAFIPAVTYIADAVGTQSETILIRTVALQKDFSFATYVLREIPVGLGLSSILSLIIAGVSFAIWHNPLVSLILGISFCIAILAAMASAIFLPWLLSKLRLDPAVTSGPIDTIFADITSITVYFLVATAVLKFFTL